MEHEGKDVRGSVEYARKEGREEGIKEGQYTIAHSMLADGMDPAVVMRYTGLSETELAALTKA